MFKKISSQATQKHGTTIFGTVTYFRQLLD